MVKISVFSFGYHKSGIPKDQEGNNGGFVFDCRFLPNPHNDENLRPYTGKEKPIIDFFKNLELVNDYLEKCLSLVKVACKEYDKKGYQNLQVSFGCTGGKHRSVYCSEKFTSELNKMGYRIELKHLEI